jgi:hypothetical protein
MKARSFSFAFAACLTAAGCGTAPALRSIQDSGSISAHREAVGPDGKISVRHKILNRDEVRTVKDFAAANLTLTAPGDCPERRGCDVSTVVRIKLTDGLLTIVPDCDTAVLTNGATFGDCGLGRTAAYKRLDAVLFPPVTEPRP